MITRSLVLRRPRLVLPGGDRRSPVEGLRHKGVFHGYTPRQAPGFLLCSLRELPPSRRLCGQVGGKQVARATRPNNYWSASTYAPDADGAWYIYFYDGGLYAFNKPLHLSVRAVRGGS